MASLEEAGRSVRQVAARISSASTIFSRFLSFPCDFEGSECVLLLPRIILVYDMFFGKLKYSIFPRYTLMVFKTKEFFDEANFGRKCDNDKIIFFN